MIKYLFLCSALKLLQLVLVSSIKRVSGRIFKDKSCRGVVKKRKKIFIFKPSAAEKKQHANSSHVTSSKTVLGSGFHALDSGIQVLNSSLCQWILDSNCSWDSGSLSGILDSKAQDSEFQKKIFPGVWIPQEQITRIPESAFPYVERANSHFRMLCSFSVLDEGVSHNLFCFGRLLLSGNGNNGNLLAGC